ncbi:MAG: phosphoribosylformylglycinamidine cyclo-ligase [Clostridia bacterium]|nr:phosphoribosylformylglycinamidine cyclo-ligase [Clostridia bacterium]MDY5264394.1 phosphoribosylformylglycinamidine cyclo-ligase [Eubacteriales bacterium]
MIDYKSAGVDVEAGYEAVKLMKEYVKTTYDKNVLGELGSFGGFYALDDKEDGDVLVAGTDGVGTKLKYAFISDKHDTIGIDCVAMCVNDIVCQGAKPLLFLDYLAQSKIDPVKVASIVKGISDGCRESGCALIGGETAEMPGFYADGEYDMAGFAVGIAKKNKIINGSNIVKGDVLIGLKSSGIHSNGYSLVRKLFGEDIAKLDVYNEELGAKPIDVLLTPTKLYVKTILDLIEKYEVKGIAHITGGGFIENIPRILPKGLAAKVDINSYEVPAVFRVMQKLGDIPTEKIYNTFNMGIGMVLAVDKNIADDVVKYLNKNEADSAVIIGEVVEGEGVLL